MNAKVNGAHYMLAAVRELAPQRAFILLDPARCSAIRRISRRTKKLFSARPPLWNLQGSRVLSDTQLSGSLRTLLLFRNSLRHESLRRDFEFVTRKITSQAARIKLGLAHELRFGNLDARRDWGHTREYVKAMWMMLQREHPDDYVIATGVNYSVRDFAEMAFAALGLELDRYLRIDDRYKRPAEVDNLLGDCPKAKKELGWEYNLTLRDLVREMVECHLLLLGRQTGIALAASVGGR